MYHHTQVILEFIGAILNAHLARFTLAVENHAKSFLFVIHFNYIYNSSF